MVFPFILLSYLIVNFFIFLFFLFFFFFFFFFFSFYVFSFFFFFFFQAEDGIRDLTVTGVQTCALPISLRSAEECVKAVDVLVITTPWKQFGEIPASAFARAQGRLQVLDCWRVLSREKIGAVADIHYLGTCEPPPPAKRMFAVASR